MTAMTAGKLNKKLREKLADFRVENVPIDKLKPHPENYREHPQEQIDHIIASIKANTFTRNVVCARDYTLLGGHGVHIAAQQMGLDVLPARVLDLDPNSPRALAVLAGDNEIGELGIINDRQLVTLLAKIKKAEGLEGTGYDEMRFANLLFITRPPEDIEEFDEYAEWIGLPEYEPLEEPWKITVNFDSVEDRDKFAELLGITLTDKVKSIWYPHRERDDVSSIEFREKE